jgi:hypothetical protein
LVRHYQKKRNRIDFEFIYRNDFFNRYARIFYTDQAAWSLERCEAEDFANSGMDHYPDEWNSTENNLTDLNNPVRVEPLFQSKHSFQENQKSMRTSTKVKIECQKKAVELWGEAQKNGAYILSSSEMANHPDIVKIGRDYLVPTRQRWLSKVAPEKAKKPGVRSKKSI